MRREPSFYREAIESCRKDKSFITSSQSVSEIDYAKKGFNDSKGWEDWVFKTHGDAVLATISLKTPSKLQFHFKTTHTWINTTILNSTHVQDGNEILLIRDTPFGKYYKHPHLPTVVFYSMDTQKLQIGVTEKIGRVSF